MASAHCNAPPLTLIRAKAVHNLHDISTLDSARVGLTDTLDSARVGLTDRWPKENSKVQATKATLHVCTAAHTHRQTG